MSETMASVLGSKFDTITCDNTSKVNVMLKEDFLNRAEKVFQLYEDILKKTLGAYGSPTIISNYPYRHVTKDGYTVCRNIEFDRTQSSPVDKVIGEMLTSICSRLNYAVGDGTTSAIIATNQIFRSVMNNMKVYADVRPKDFMDCFGEVKEEIIKNLQDAAIMINNEHLSEYIEKVVRVSSNNDETLVSIITDAYKEIGFPAIICKKSDNMNTYGEIIDGFFANVDLGDDIYINSDDQTAKLKQADVIIFGSKVSQESYERIIKPLNFFSRACGRRLICLAPRYDDRALNGVIKRDMQTEFKAAGTVNLVICSYFANGELARKQIYDLAIVLGTTVIDKDLEERIFDALDEKDLAARNAGVTTHNPITDIVEVANIMDRGIGGLKIWKETGMYTPDTLSISEEKKVYDEDRLSKTLFDLGFVDECSIGTKKRSYFKNSHYDEKLYQAALKEAENDLNDVIEKFQILGTYTRDVYEAQQRYASLKMKISNIYVGGDSDLSREMRKDSAEDAIRAAESAYHYGYVQGCNLTLSMIVKKMYDEAPLGSLKKNILGAILSAFKEVYKVVLENAFGSDHKLIVSIDSVASGKLSENAQRILAGVLIGTTKINENIDSVSEYITLDVVRAAGRILSSEESEKLSKATDANTDETTHVEIDINKFIVEISMNMGLVLNLDTMKFSDDIINSAKTDIEILTATSDLLSILVVGNQVVMASWNHSNGNY